MTESENRRHSHLIEHREQYFLLALLAAALYGAFKVIQPYLHALILGAILAALFYPLYKWWRIKLKSRKNLAATASVITVGLLVVAPLTGFAIAITAKGLRSLTAAQKWIEDGKLKQLTESDKITKIVESPLVQKAMAFRDRYMPGFDEASITEKAAGWAAGLAEFFGGQIMPILSNALGLLVSFGIMLFAMFYFFRDGGKIMAFISRITPMSRENEERLVARILEVSRSAVIGTAGTAAAQSVLAMIAFAVVGLEWLFWGIMLGFASLIPVVGTALIWIPACLYLLAIGKVAAAIGLAIYCIVVVGSADNFLRPYLMGGSSGLSSMVVFFAILGGIQLYGLVGVLYGPLIFGLCAVLLYIYQLEVSDDQPAPAPAIPTDHAEPDSGPEPEEG
jgi:predicted PurR-regulated permease PerM